MKRKLVWIVTSLVLSASIVGAVHYVPRASMTLLFDQYQQKHPKVESVALPIMGPVVGVDGGPLSFSAMYQTPFIGDEDPRRSKGKVKVTIKVVRDDQVIWQESKRSKIKYDRYTTWECGNCTHNLDFCNSFDGSLKKGDLLLFQFRFKKMPRFTFGDVAEMGGEVYVTDECE